MWPVYLALIVIWLADAKPTYIPLVVGIFATCTVLEYLI
jgi:hypothetical protein